MGLIQWKLTGKGTQCVCGAVGGRGRIGGESGRVGRTRAQVFRDAPGHDQRVDEAVDDGFGERPDQPLAGIVRGIVGFGISSTVMASATGPSSRRRSRRRCAARRASRSCWTSVESAGACRPMPACTCCISRFSRTPSRRRRSRPCPDAASRAAGPSRAASRRRGRSSLRPRADRPAPAGRRFLPAPRILRFAPRRRPARSSRGNRSPRRRVIRSRIRFVAVLSLTMIIRMARLRTVSSVSLGEAGSTRAGDLVTGLQHEALVPPHLPGRDQHSSAAEDGQLDCAGRSDSRVGALANSWPVRRSSRRAPRRP